MIDFALGVAACFFCLFWVGRYLEQKKEQERIRRWYAPTFTVQRFVYVRRR